jgi:hypothetical protein
MSGNAGVAEVPRGGAGDAVREFWAALQARDSGRLSRTLAVDVVATWPDSRQRIRGREALVRVLATELTDRTIELGQVLTDMAGGAICATATINGERLTGITFFGLDHAGLIASITEFWPRDYHPAIGHEGLFERY